MNKTRVRIHLQYGWWIYLLIVAAAAVVWCTVFAGLAQPRANERLNLVLVGEFDAEALSEDLLETLEGKTVRPLKEINVEVVSGENGMLADIITMRCIGDTDLIIFEASYLLEDMESCVAALDDDMLDTYIGHSERYEENGEALGLLLYDGEKKTNFSEYYSGHDVCWAFVTPVSQNAAALNGEGDEADDAVLRVIRYLMERQ